VIVAVVVAHVTAARLAPPAEPEEGKASATRPGAAAKVADRAP
jgi:hypothetical protein